MALEVLISGLCITGMAVSARFFFFFFFFGRNMDYIMLSVVNISLVDGCKHCISVLAVDGGLY